MTQSLQLLPPDRQRQPLPEILTQHIDAAIAKFWPKFAPSSVKPVLRQGLIELATDVYNMGWIDAEAARTAEVKQNSEDAA